MLPSFVPEAMMNDDELASKPFPPWLALLCRAAVGRVYASHRERERGGKGAISAPFSRAGKKIVYWRFFSAEDPL